jgi:hypothetical protein
MAGGEATSKSTLMTTWVVQRKRPEWRELRLRRGREHGAERDLLSLKIRVIVGEDSMQDGGKPFFSSYLVSIRR